MGIRLAMKKELMGLEHSDLLTADDVRAHLAQQVKATARIHRLMSVTSVVTTASLIVQVRALRVLSVATMTQPKYR